jgi:hypothetical protein
MALPCPHGCRLRRLLQAELKVTPEIRLVDDAAQVCGRLITAGAVRRIDLPELDHPAVREEVERRLARCGFVLASSAYSDHYGIRLVVDADNSVLDKSSNLGLDSGTCALVTILWAKLALQKRTAADQQFAADEQGELLAETKREKAQAFQPSIRFETLVQEFGPKLGGKVRLQAMLGHLKRMKFVEYRRLDEVRAGPLLELAIDGERMIGFIRSRVLSQYLENIGDSTGAAPDPIAGLTQKIIRALSAAGRPLSIAELESSIGAHRRETKQALRVLREDQRVETIGSGSKTAYRILATGS